MPPSVAPATGNLGWPSFTELERVALERLLQDGTETPSFLVDRCVALWLNACLTPPATDFCSSCAQLREADPARPGLAEPMSIASGADLLAAPRSALRRSERLSRLGSALQAVGAVNVSLGHCSLVSA